MLQTIVLRDASAAQWLLFTEPVDVLIASRVEDIRSVFDSVEERVNREGLIAAGFVSYEAAPAFDASFATRPPGQLPLAAFGLYRRREPLATLPFRDGAERGGRLRWQLDTTRDVYRSNIDDIKRQIALGNTYQVNYSIRQRADGLTDPRRFFCDVAADAPFAAYLDCGDRVIVSASPELFFELNGDRLVCRPMKGTAARGMTTAEDERIRDALRRSTKDRAENVMIADMVRNDVGRVADAGSVRASSLFDLEKYRTVWQMTSTVEATTHAPVTEIFRALFPSASITGAPKVASMRLIAGIETSPREVYTGCIGFIGPDRHCRFSVAIRTAIVDQGTGTATYGIGGGIVWDSDPDAEYEECLSKATVLDSAGDGGEFELLETMMWTRRDGYRLLDEHLERLTDSARYFDFTCNRLRIETELRAYLEQLGGFAHVIRLLLRRDGTIRLETREPPQHDADTLLRLRLAPEPVDLRNPFLYHKTTKRAHYDRALSAAGDCDDALLWNERGEITEATIANVIVRIEDGLYTPPVSSGLLNGTLRRNLLAQGKIAERVVRIDELPAIADLYLVNSVRGWRRAVIDGKSTATR